MATFRGGQLANRRAALMLGLVLSITGCGRNHKLAFRARNATENPAAAPVSVNMPSLTQTNEAALNSADFQRRCRTAGVVKCVGFDSQSEITPYIRPAGDGTIRGTLDGNIKASGAGSLRFEIPSPSGPNTSGSWVAPLGSAFGPGDTFYVQFRQRFDHAMLTTDFGGGGWKQAVFHTQPTGCASIELATSNIWYRGFPQMYTDCGARGLYTNNGVPPYLLQQGDYKCKYGSENPKDCSFYREDQWMTFYYRIKLGNWGHPQSSIEAWVAYEGQPLKKFVDMHNFRLDYNNGPSDRFDTITLMPYNTGKPSNKIHPTAYTWYDELIISTQPILAPNGPTPSGSDPR